MNQVIELLDQCQALTEDNERLKKQNAEYIEALREAALQIEYLHQKFQPTGTGESVLVRIKALTNDKTT